MKLIPQIFLALLLSSVLFGQECSTNWDMYFDTDPLHSKYLSGDTSTGYAVFSFWGDPRLKLEIHGEFPRSRFMSLETESTRLAISEDHLFDRDIEPEPGSWNPFRNGVSLEVESRAFRVTALQNKESAVANTVQLPEGYLPQAIMFRIYSPHAGVVLSEANLPRIYAFDRDSGEPARCPMHATYDPAFHFPQFLADIYTAVKPFEFNVAQDMKIAGLNQAAAYMFAVTPLEKHEVVWTRFRKPRFTQTHSGEGVFSDDGEVRYWSFCTNNFPKNQTLNCVPDFLAAVDSNHDVNVIVGTGDEVQIAARERGFSFLPDTRRPLQRVMGFVYRNLLPSESFRKERMYQGEYSPSVVVCSRADFLANVCAAP